MLGGLIPMVTKYQYQPASNKKGGHIRAASIQTGRTSSNLKTVAGSHSCKNGNDLDLAVGNFVP